MAAEKKGVSVASSVVMIARSTVHGLSGVMSLPGEEVELLPEDADRLLAAGLVSPKAEPAPDSDG